MGEFLEAVYVEYGTRAFTTSDLVDVLEGDPNLVATLPDDLSADWTKRDKGVSFVRRLGKAFSAREGRRHGEMESRVERAGEARNVQKWRVVRNVPEKFLQFQPAEPELEAEEAKETGETIQELEPGFVAA